MVYHVIGTMSGSSMDGLDIVHTTIEEVSGKWSYQINYSECIALPEKWQQTLPEITTFSAKELLLTHTAFGKWMGESILQFIHRNQLDHKVHFIASHGHTVFHEPQQGMTFQMGDGAAIAAITQIPVITDLRNMDVALGGQGAPIVPIGEKLFWPDYKYFLNIGGIANISFREENRFSAFDICPANRVLNALSHELGKAFDDKGVEASTGLVNDDLLYDLNDIAYYKKPFPKSLSNEFGLDIILQSIQAYDIPVRDKLRTMCAHVVAQIASVIPAADNEKMLVTGGGAYNDFLVNELRTTLSPKHIDVVLPDRQLIDFKEALVMALIGTLRWREETNVLASVTGAKHNSIGGALWMS